MIRDQIADNLDDTAHEALLRNLEPYLGAGEDRDGFTSRGPVSARVIRQMTDLLGDLNPIYTSDEAAHSYGHPGIVAPPTMLHVWSLPGLEASEGQEMLDASGTRRFRQAPYGERIKAVGRRTLRDEVNDVMAASGYSSPAVTNMAFEYHRYVSPGDVLHFSSWIVESIVGPKQTGLGEGFFVTIRLSIKDQHGEPVGTIRQTYLRSKPRPAKDRPAAPVPGATQVSGTDETVWKPIFPQSPTGSLQADVVAVGDRLPVLLVDITPTLIIGGAIASQDFQDVHHDREAAERRGHPDVYMNILTSTGLVGRYVTDWAGPGARLRSLSIRLGRPNYPGDQMRMEGEIVATAVISDIRELTIRIIGSNRLGNHLTSEVVVELPAAGR